MQDHGVQFYVKGLNRPLRGSIGPFSDDNLGAHVVGGFIESFSSLRVCRICMGTNDDIQTKVKIYFSPCRKIILLVVPEVRL